jgi:hypothetical protein
MWHRSVEFQLTCEMEGKVRYMDLLIIRYDHFYELDISRKPTTNVRTNNNYTTFLLNLNWQLMLISEIIGIRLVDHTIHSNIPRGKKAQIPIYVNSGNKIQ